MDRDPKEAERLRALYNYGVLDTDPEQRYDDLVQIASSICDTPIALVSFVDSHRQWFKARVGIDARETPREIAFCAHAIENPDELLVINDASTDPRFAANPLVTGDPNIRFYAGAPIIDRDHHALGTLCVIDKVPRQLNETQKSALQALARQVRDQLALDKLNRQLNTSLKTLDEYTSIAVHDLQSPLRTMKYFADILTEDYAASIDAKGIEYLNYISEGANRLKRLVNDLLDYARLDKQAIEISRVDMQEVTKGVIDLLTPSIQQTNGEVRIRGTLPVVYGHEVLLQELLQNLIENALKYHRQTIPPEVEISVESSNLEHVFAVKDNGIGIEPDRHEDAFTAFKRLHGTEITQGSGLGLSFCRKSIELHSGRIWIESALDQGTTIKFTLPN